MNTEIQAQQVNLQAPGAGLPWQQRLLMRLYFGPIKSNMTSWEESQSGFQAVTDKIVKALEGLSDHELATPVLVPPLPGIEDSSRNWSIAMTLEHLCITGRGTCEIIHQLSQEKNPKIVVETKNLKPLGKTPPAQVISQFKSFCYSDVPKMETSVSNRKAKAKHYHPWFGMFTTHQWHWLLTMHQGLHYNHIKEIKNLLQYKKS